MRPERGTYEIWTKGLQGVGVDSGARGTHDLVTLAETRPEGAPLTPHRLIVGEPATYCYLGVGNNVIVGGQARRGAEYYYTVEAMTKGVGKCEVDNKHRFNTFRTPVDDLDLNTLEVLFDSQSLLRSNDTPASPSTSHVPLAPAEVSVDNLAENMRQLSTVPSPEPEPPTDDEHSNYSDNPSGDKAMAIDARPARPKDVDTLALVYGSSPLFSLLVSD